MVNYITAIACIQYLGSLKNGLDMNLSATAQMITARRRGNDKSRFVRLGGPNGTLGSRFGGRLAGRFSEFT